MCIKHNGMLLMDGRQRAYHSNRYAFSYLFKLMQNFNFFWA
jgi:hypothetical protein